jgi:hypothetical protein
MTKFQPQYLLEVSMVFNYYKGNRKSWVFSGFLPQGKLIGWVRASYTSSTMDKIRTACSSSIGEVIY